MKINKIISVILALESAYLLHEIDFFSIKSFNVFLTLPFPYAVILLTIVLLLASAIGLFYNKKWSVVVLWIYVLSPFVINLFTPWLGNSPYFRIFNLLAVTYLTTIFWKNKKMLPFFIAVLGGLIITEVPLYYLELRHRMFVLLFFAVFSLSVYIASRSKIQGNNKKLNTMFWISVFALSFILQNIISFGSICTETKEMTKFCTSYEPFLYAAPFLLFFMFYFPKKLFDKKQEYFLLFFVSMVFTFKFVNISLDLFLFDTGWGFLALSIFAPVALFFIFLDVLIYKKSQKALKNI